MELEASLSRTNRNDSLTAGLSRELGALYPTFVSLSVAREVMPADSLTDSLGMNVVATWQRLPARAEQERVRRFLSLRLEDDSVQVSHLVRTRR
jgi:hypothetical protein